MGKRSFFVGVLIVTVLLISISTASMSIPSSAADPPVVNISYQKAFHEDVLLPSTHVTPSVDGGRKHTILMRSTRIDTGVDGPPIAVSSTVMNGEGTWNDHYYIVQFQNYIQDEWKDSLFDAGAKIINYIPNNAFIVRMDPSVLATVETLDHVHWVGVYQPEYKIDSRLAPLLTGPEDITVLLFGPEQNANVSRKIEALGGRVIGRSMDVIHVNIDASKMADISAMDEVRWIEKYTEPVIQNNVACGIINATIIHNTYSLNGSGQVIGIADTGLDASHPDLQGRIDALIDLSDNGPEDIYSGHGTHVSGSVLGNGSASNCSFAGTAPEAHLVFQAVEDADESLGGIPANLTVLFQQAYNNGARIHSNSWGSSSYGVYTSYSQHVDLFMWEHPDMLILFSAGNDGVDSDSDGVVDQDSMGAPATAKNCLTIGASENYRPSIITTYGASWPGDYPVNPIYSDYMANEIEGMAAFSSRGPTDDGRTKPDVVAPGTFLISTRSSDANGTGWGVYDQYYLYMGGSSMATPLTAGAAALVRQHYMDDLNITPSAALVKATLIHGAHDMYPGQYGNDDVAHVPDHSQGWGMVDLKEALYPSNSRSIHYSDNTSQLTTSDSVEGRYYVTNSSQSFKATLVWTDHPSDVSAQTNLVNDLDLLVTGPNGTEYGLNDSINNVEQLNIPTPDTGWYTMAITGTGIPQGPQPFATVVSGIINDPVLTVINITDASVYVNDTYNFTAQLLDQIGNPINATVLWNSSNTTVGTINESSGVFSALAGGDTMVTAANGSVNDSVVVNVTARVLTTINITTAVPDLLVDGQTLNFTADTFDQLNNTFSTSLIWNSSNTTVGTINASSGVFSALTGGDTMVTAANRSVNDSIVVNVTARMVTTINVSNASMYVGDTHSFKSETLDQFNNTFDALVNWASSDIAVGTIDVGTGLFTAHSAGTTTVTAANGSVKGNATATVSTLPAGDSGSSSSGAGGGGGTSGEAYENIVFKDAQTNIIIGGRTISYAFDTEENENDVEYINFSALRNSGRISTTIEVLKDTSTLVDEGVPGIVYRNFNIWVGNAAFGEDNIADPFIGFRVKRSWVTNNDIDISTIILYRNHDDEWVPLPTTIISENESYIYFKAATPGFSPFAISGEQMNDGQLVGHTKTNITSSIQQPLFENISTSSQKGNRDRSAFWSICVVTSILLVILSMVYLYNQKKETK